MKSIFDRIAANGEDSPEDSRAESVSSVTNGQPLGSVEDETSRTSVAVKETTQELLKYGYLEEGKEADQFRKVLMHQREIIAALEPLDLTVKVDSLRGVAYLVVPQSTEDNPNNEDGWTHPLVRRQRLTLEQSLLVAILRQAFMLHEQETGVGQSPATITIDELLSHFLTYFDDSGSDAKNETRLLNLLEQLKTYGIVSEVDSKHEVTIRPLIAHLANPESLAALLTVLKEQQSHPTAGDDNS